MIWNRSASLSQWTRRDVLKTSGAAALGLALGLGTARRATAAWGEVPASVWGPTFQPFKVLEIHLFGGTAPFESFYYRDVAGSRTRGFDTEFGTLNWNAACPGTPSGLELQSFSTDSSGKDIHLGPLSKPLWRADIRSRMRILVQGHDLLPHQAAIPYTMTGSRLGRANLAPLGAAIQHHRSALDEAAATGRVLPHSYALLPENGAGADLFNLVGQVQSSIGAHPGAAQPLALRIGPGLASFVTLLERGNLGVAKEAFGDLLNQYRARYRDRLRFPAGGAVTRSPIFRDYDTAVQRLSAADSLKDLLAAAPTAIGNKAACAKEILPFMAASSNPTFTALQFAAFLLTRPANEAASSVFVLDSGLVRTDLPYDVHNSNHATDTSSNLWNLLDALTSLIKDPANPSPADPDKIDLANTLVIINTEFGRTPFKSLGDMEVLGSLGRDHWPSAYVTVMFGGPIPAAADGAPGRVVGSIVDGTGELAVADIRYTATDMRAAAMLASGVNPFEPENFALGQLTGSLVVGDHAATMAQIRQTLLGVS